MNVYQSSKRRADTLSLIMEGLLEFRLDGNSGVDGPWRRRWRTVGAHVGWHQALLTHANELLDAGLIDYVRPVGRAVDEFDPELLGWVPVSATRAGDHLFKLWREEPFAVMHRDQAESKANYVVDAVVLAQFEGEWWTLLIERKHPPFQGSWALPGGHVGADENSVAAVQRELTEETGVTFNVQSWDLVGVYDDPDRDSRGRVVSAAYVASLNVATSLPELKAGDDAKKARWLPMSEVAKMPLAFDHWEILADAVQLNDLSSSYVRVSTADLSERIDDAARDLSAAYVEQSGLLEDAPDRYAESLRPHAERVVASLLDVENVGGVWQPSI